MPAAMFTTTDLAIAAYLVTLGHRLLRVDGPRGRRVFVFPGVLESAVNDEANTISLTCCHCDTSLVLPLA
jgi:hypothetical protein